ncbi:MAG: beta-lactamase family protein [Chloroflexi bacterium]|nr:beta-lactamase family protein [Chloroflexota bacterium]
MRRLKAFCTVVTLISLLLATPLSALGQTPNAPDAYEQVRVIARSQIWKEINSGKASSATVAVMDGGKIVYSEGFGMADREKSIRVDRDTLFNIGSVSKAFTASAIMLLVQGGKVSLDDPVIQYLPEFTMSDPRYRDITVRMLLNHTSGIPGSSLANVFGFEYNHEAFQHTLDNLSRSHLRHAPGEMAAYTNDGFTLAEMIMERVSGQKFIDFLGQYVFKPLGMQDTGRSVGEQTGKVVAAYYSPASGSRHPLEVISVLGPGGLGSTAEDLVRFGDTFSRAGNRILSPASLEEMRKAQPPAFLAALRNAGWSFGLGLDVTDVPQYQEKGIKVLGKGGGTLNYASMLYIAPDQRLGVAAIEAGVGANANVIALALLDALLVQKGLVPGQGDTFSSRGETVTRPPEPQPIPPEYSAFEGYYQGDLGLRKVVLDPAANTVTLLPSKNLLGAPMSYFYDGDYLYNPVSKHRAYFVDSNGKKYFVLAGALGIGDLVMLQSLDKIENPQRLRIDLTGKTWLRRNVKPYVSIYDSATHIVNSDTIEDLPGYVDFRGALPVKSLDFAGMPGGLIRDQVELTLIDRDGAIWARLSDMLYMPAELAGVLSEGENEVTIDASGYNEWLVAAEDLVLSFEKPAKGRVIVFSPEGASTYDSAVGRGDVYVEEGSLVELAGVPGDVFRVIAKGFGARLLSQPSPDSWEDQFEAVHGRQPTAQDVADRQWSLEFVAKNSRSPQQADWEKRWREAQQK